MNLTHQVWAELINDTEQCNRVGHGGHGVAMLHGHRVPLTCQFFVRWKLITVIIQKSTLSEVHQDELRQWYDALALYKLTACMCRHGVSSCTTHEWHNTAIADC